MAPTPSLPAPLDLTLPSNDFSPAVRALIMERDGHRCVVCGRFLGEVANIHHRRLRSQGGTGAAENGITVCGSGTMGCHGKIHQHIATSRSAGLIVPSWDDPALIPVNTWRGTMLLLPDGNYLTKAPE